MLEFHIKILFEQKILLLKSRPRTPRFLRALLAVISCVSKGAAVGVPVLGCKKQVKARAAGGLGRGHREGTIGSGSGRLSESSPERKGKEWNTRQREEAVQVAWRCKDWEAFGGRLEELMWLKQEACGW